MIGVCRRGRRSAKMRTTTSRQLRVHPGSSPQNAGPVARRPRTLLSVACRPPKIVYSHTASYAQRAADLLDVVVGLLSAHAPSLPPAPTRRILGPVRPAAPTSPRSRDPPPPRPILSKPYAHPKRRCVVVPAPVLLPTRPRHPAFRPARADWRPRMRPTDLRRLRLLKLAS